jgi:[ribosomal protein S5]-alanine N-acetyltransferase
MTEPDVRLRAIAESDLDTMARFATEPDAIGEFEWFGFQDARTFRRRWEEDGWIGANNTWLAVVTGEGDGTLVGIVSWRDKSEGTNQQVCFELGVAMLPEHRGRGLGTAAQRAVVEHLWTTTQVHRIQARTEAENIAEQRALEKIGFEREGLMREVLYRDGRWRDGLIYGLLRPPSEGQPNAE